MEGQGREAGRGPQEGDREQHLCTRLDGTGVQPRIGGAAPVDDDVLRGRAPQEPGVNDGTPHQGAEGQGCRQGMPSDPRHRQACRTDSQRDVPWLDRVKPAASAGAFVRFAP
jgi:hypothetical protein